MVGSTTELSTFHSIVYNSLDGILKKAGIKSNIKSYAIINQGSEIKGIVRMRKTLSEKKHEKTKINLETLNKVEDISTELDIEMEDAKQYTEDLLENIKKSMLITPNSESIRSEITINESSSESFIEPINSNSNSKLLKSRVLYTNNFTIKCGKEMFTVTYILELRNVEKETYELFCEFPDISFLKMILNYFFNDYFEDNKGKYLKINNNSSIDRKYNEDSIQFIRRVTRLFYSKIQVLMQNETNITTLSSAFDQEGSKQFYINNFLEKIDDISTRTYEGSNPFGCIVFFKRHLLEIETKIIKFIIRFSEEELVSLDDSKRIRKLLEISNCKNDLFLISDHEYVYGLGEINWNNLNENKFFKIEFKGLSRSTLQLVSILERPLEKGYIATDNGKKIYKAEKKLEIRSLKLISIMFKTPILGDEGYKPDSFNKIMRHQFLEQEEVVDLKGISLLQDIVSIATEQKHGTMVVITEYKTAVSELKKLKKQSTLVTPTLIDAKYIRYITSIDGAIYFDINGYCHAIGVILDGKAAEDIGDSSRGARYNSALRYMHKLKESSKKCVIVIISEDGMVNIIPEIDNEEQIQTIFHQIIDALSGEYNIEELAELEEQFNSYKDIDYQLYFKMAEVCFSKKNYKKVIEYTGRGLSLSGNNYIPVNYYRKMANSYFYLARTYKYKDKERKVNYIKAINVYDSFMDSSSSADLNHHDYNNRAISLESLGDLEKKEEIKNSYYYKAMSDYTKAIEVNTQSNILYSNRAGSYLNLMMLEEALEDLIAAELIEHDEDYVKGIFEILNNNNYLFENALMKFNQIKNSSNKEGIELRNKFKEYLQILQENNPEVAGTLEKSYFNE